ncbi:hypothetical protein PVAND_016671 [Polypedilum vanderplanki]|uniref:Uncharacterized protein n=1 Tax=Polypedilum vanderplanki TaxID=319348 RepID=A0A9J6BGG3_POLVA|nr:hypothetical protein PVAND_016671 [Polypedilum vanderplanki]
MAESSIKKAIILSNTGIETFYKVCKMQPVLLKENLLTLPVAMVTFPNHFLFDVINEHTIWLVQAGIPQYWFQYQNWYSFFRHHKIESDELESINLDSLSFGFIIWLATCGISLIVFAIEIGMWQKIINLWTQKWQAEDDNKNKIKKLKVKTKLIHVKPAGNDENFLNKVRKP